MKNFYYLLMYDGTIYKGTKVIRYTPFVSTIKKDDILCIKGLGTYIITKVEPYTLGVYLIGNIMKEV